MFRWIKRIARLFLIIFCLGLVALYFTAPHLIVSPVRMNWNRHPSDYNVPFDSLRIAGHDTVVLRGYWIRSKEEKSDRPVVILLHGISNCKEKWLPTAAWLWENGYEAIVVDHRAHGESTGKYCTFGYFEKYDVQKVVEHVHAVRPGASIGVWGNSLGGAIALQALSIEPRLQFGIVESTFADFRDIVYDYQVRMFKLPSRWFANDGIARAAAIAGFEPDSVRPAYVAHRIRQPVLMLHGDADEKINIRYGQMIFASLGSADKEFHTIEGAGHHNVSYRGGAAYKRMALDFLDCQRKTANATTN
jgi:uncharacterized protein